MLWNEWERRELIYKDGAVFKTRIVEKRWFAVTDEPGQDKILSDNTCWYITGRTIAQKDKPEDL